MSETKTQGSPQSNGQILPNQKLRTTCNACQQAKIRCSHSHPCDRCVSHGSECVYSISQPLGRPAKKKGNRPTAGVQTSRAGAEAGDRPRGQNATRPPRPALASMRRRIARRIRPQSSFEERGESRRGDCGTEVTLPESNEVPILTEEIPIPSRDRIQDQEITNFDAGAIDTILDIDGTSGFPFNLPNLSDFQEGPQSPGLGFNFCIQNYTPSFGLISDEAPMHQPVDGDPSSLRIAAPEIYSRSPFKFDAIYPFCLAPDARQVSGTIQGPWRIMELPSNEVAHDQLDSSSGQSPSPEEIDYESLSEDSSSTRCDCFN